MQSWRCEDSPLAALLLKSAAVLRLLRRGELGLQTAVAPSRFSSNRCLGINVVCPSENLDPALDKSSDIRDLTNRSRCCLVKTPPVAPPAPRSLLQ